MREERKGEEWEGMRGEGSGREEGEGDTGRMKTKQEGWKGFNHRCIQYMEMAVYMATM